MYNNLYDIITIGSNTLDVFVRTDSELIEIRNKQETEELLAYPLGTKILIKNLEFMIGGGGTNTAVAFSRLGLKTGYLGKIGKDESGLKIFKLLKNEKIDFLGTLGKISGYSIILDSIDDDRTILTYKGCNDNLSFNEVKLGKLQSKWLYFSSMTGKSLETIKKIAEYAHKKNIKIAFNPSSYLAEKGFSYLKRILQNTTILILNKEEAELIVGRGDIKDIIKRIKLPTMEQVIITDGNKGAYCYDGNKLYNVKPFKKLVIKETTGAGDAFASTFIAAVIMGKKTEEAIKMAAINAESVIQNYGAKNILLTKKELLKKLKNDKRTVKIIKI